MLFANTIKNIRTSPWQAILLFILIACINVYIVAVPGPNAPGFGFLVGTVGTVVGVGVGLLFAPKSPIADHFGDSVSSLLDAL